MRLRPIALLGVLALLLSACGAPSQKYGESKSEGVYFTVPYSWHEITSAQLNAEEAKSTSALVLDRLALVKWQEAYSQSSGLAAKDVYSLKAPDVPLVFARVRALYPEEANAMSYNLLRDVVWPVTDWVNNPTATTPVYNIVDDHEVVQKGARGVRTIFSVVRAGVSQTIDQTSLMSPDHQKLYVLFVRCTTVCYNKNIKVMSRIADSFTVRGAK